MMTDDTLALYTTIPFLSREKRTFHVYKGANTDFDLCNGIYTKTALVYTTPLQENHFEFSTCWGSNPLPSQIQTLFISETNEQTQIRTSAMQSTQKIT